MAQAQLITAAMLFEASSLRGDRVTSRSDRDRCFDELGGLLGMPCPHLDAALGQDLSTVPLPRPCAQELGRRDHAPRGQCSPNDRTTARGSLILWIIFQLEPLPFCSRILKEARNFGSAHQRL